MSIERGHNTCVGGDGNIMTRSHLLLNSIQHTSDTGIRRIKRPLLWPWAMLLGACGGFLLGCSI